MKILFICKHNLGRSQIARAFYNHLTSTNDAISAGTLSILYKEKTMADFGRETRSIRAMREIGLDLSKADRQQLIPKLAENVEQIVSFLSPPDLPKWLRSDTRLKFWQLENYPAPDFATVRRQRDEIVDLVQNLLK